MFLRLPDSWSNWNLEMLVFEEREKPEYPEKNLSEQRREPTTNSTHIWRRRRDLNPGHVGGRRALSPLRHPLSRPCKVQVIHYGLGFWIPSRGFRITCQWNLDSGFLELNSGFQSPGVQTREAKTSRIPEFRLPYMSVITSLLC